MSPEAKAELRAPRLVRAPPAVVAEVPPLAISKVPVIAAVPKLTAPHDGAPPVIPSKTVLFVPAARETGAKPAPPPTTN